MVCLQDYDTSTGSHLWYACKFFLKGLKISDVTQFIYSGIYTPCPYKFLTNFSDIVLKFCLFCHLPSCK